MEIAVSHMLCFLMIGNDTENWVVGVSEVYILFACM